MKLLLDTHILIWISLDMLPRAAEKYILDEFNQLYFSPANIWEIVIKRGIGRADFNVDPHMLYSALLENGYEELSITSRHVLSIGTMPKLHKDPFDRILLAQSVIEQIPLLTSDVKMAKYPAPVILVK